MMTVPPEKLKPAHTVTEETDPEALSQSHRRVQGYDFNEGLDLSRLLDSYATMGIQGSQLSKAIGILSEMLAWRSPGNEKCTVFLGFTSGGATSGTRELIRFLAEHRLVDVVVTTAAAVEEDLMKCSGSHFLSNFRENDALLRDKGIVRMGNVITTRGHYSRFAAQMQPLLDEMLERQDKERFNWTPSKAIDFWGARAGDKSSIFHWCHRNGIQVFCPGFTDGAVGEALLEHHENNASKLRIDVVEDVRGMNDAALKAKRSGVLILGGGVIKHHILNANLMRNGADYAVFVNSAQEFDASDTGAKPTEALSWGKLALDCKRVKVYSEFSLVFPLMVAKAFYPEQQKRRAESASES